MPPCAAHAALLLALAARACCATVFQIRAAYVTDYPGPFVTEEESGGVYGFAVDVLEAALAELNRTSGGDTFALSIYRAPDGQFGSLNATTGVWSGVIGEVVGGAADVGLGSITWSAARDRVVDFAGPWLPAPLALLVRVTPDVGVFNWGFTAPFTQPLWAAVLGMTGVFALLLAAAERLSPFSFRNLADAGRDPERTLNTQESVTRAMMNLVGQGPWGSDASSWSTRIIVFAMAFFTLIVGTQYSGGITSSATVRRAASAITGLGDLAARGAPWGTLAGASASSFATASRDAGTRRLAATQRLYPTYDALFAAVRSGEIAAALDDGPLLSYFASQPPCDLAVVPVATAGYFSFPARSGSAFGRALQTAVLAVLEAGTIDDLVAAYGLGGECAAGAGSLAAAALTIADLAGVFYASAGMLALAFAVLAAERAVWAHRGARRGSACERLGKLCGDHRPRAAREAGARGEPEEGVEQVNPLGGKRAAEWGAGR